MKKLLITLAVPAILSGCAERYDYHGVDPKVYNEVLYPKVNKVAYNSVHHSFYFPENLSEFSPNSVYEMDQFLSRAYPSAVSRLGVSMGARDAARELYLTRLLRARGHKKSSLQFLLDKNIHRDEVVLEMDYSYVITPNCPDWRKASDINYSNTNHSNVRCATEINFAKQVANPADMDRTPGHRVVADGHLNETAIRNYRTNVVNEATDGVIETNAK